MADASITITTFEKRLTYRAHGEKGTTMDYETIDSETIDYGKIEAAVAGYDLPISFVTEEYTIERGVDDAGAFFRVTVSYSDGLCRAICYYQDGNVTETFARRSQKGEAL